MDEITLHDLLAWETRLQIVVDGPEPALSRDVSWAVAARAMAPALPALRGGEIILLPRTVLAEQSLSGQTLLTDLARQGVAATVVDADARDFGPLAGTAPIPVLALRGAPVSVEIESELNRLLTERRGELYRLGTDLGRLLSGLTASRAGLQQIVDFGHDAVAAPVIVTDRTGTILAAAPGDAAGKTGSGRFAPPGREPAMIEQPIRGGGRLWLGPVAAGRRAQAGVVADRLAVAVEAALADANWFRPRGPERADALKRLLLATSRLEASDARVQAVALGLDPNATFRVAVSPAAEALRDIQRCYGPDALIYDMAKLQAYDAILVQLKSTSQRPLPAAQPDARRSCRSHEPMDDAAWMAISGPASGLAGLSEAVRQALYVAGLLEARLIQRRMVSFDRTADMGGFWLLYRFWGTAELTGFATDILGDLLTHDRSGTLRATLLHFLESGGSRVEAADRAVIHRNTLTYRLRQIRELTKLDPTEPADRLSLHLAVLALSLPDPAPTSSI